MPSQPYFTAAGGSKLPSQRTLSTLSSGGLPAIKDHDSAELDIGRTSMQSAPGGYNGFNRGAHSITGGHSTTGGLSSTSYMRGVMHQQAANRYQQMSTRYHSRKQLQDQERVQLPPWVVHPHDILAQVWWTFILCTVLVTLFVEPYSLAFAAFPGLHPIDSPDTILAIIFTAVYSADVLLNFFVAFYEDGQLVTDLARIASHYAQWRLWLDLMTTIPFDWIVLGCLGLQASNSQLAWYISLLRLLRLGRAYRLWGWIHFLTYNQTLSLLAVTLVRNFLILFYVVHWAACMFYFIAKQHYFEKNTWVGAAEGPSFQDTSAVEKYVFAMYWSIITFATVGYGDLHAYNVAEALFIVIYLFCSICIAAYIVGTITLLVVRSDEKTGRYRESLETLDAYSTTHEIPGALKSAMKGHLALHYSSVDASDEVVLSKFPTNIRRRILRHLYSQPLASCWLFEGVKQKFLDAILAASKVELYLPKVEVISEGDHVNELFLLVVGQCLGERGSSLATTGCSENLMLHSDGTSSVHGGSLIMLGPGDPVGEMAFFTETACLESIRTETICRMLVIPRTVYTALTDSFPVSTRQIMTNLVDRAEQMVEREFPGPIFRSIMNDLESGTLADLGLRFASPEHTESDASIKIQPYSDVLSPRSATPPGNMQATRKSSGGSGLPPLPHTSVTPTPSVMPTGPGPKRVTPGGHRLPLPVGGGGAIGHVTAPHLATRSMPQAAAGSNGPGRENSSSSSGGGGGQAGAGNLPNLGVPLRANQQQVLSNLLRVRDMVASSRARLDQQRVNEFMNACSEGNWHRIKTMLQHGGDVNVVDYDQRTGLMLASAQGHTLAVSKLIDAGAHVNHQDKLGSSALLEAVKAGHDGVIELLMQKNGRLMMPPVMTAAQLCTAVFDGDMPLLRRLLHAGANANAGDYDKRTALHIAAADGNLPAVRILLEVGGADVDVSDRWEQSPLDEARRVGATPVVNYLQGRSSPRSAADALEKHQETQTQALLTACSKGKVSRVQELLAAGCPPDAADYDKRTGLMLAAAHGKRSVVLLLLGAGAHPNLRDNLGGSALLEAVKGGWDEIIRDLRGAGAALQMSPPELASLLCEAAAEGKLGLLRRYIAAGADVNAADYDRRTPMHIAAAEGKLSLVELLVVEGGADLAAADRWGNTPLAEATRVGAAQVVAYLKSDEARQAAVKARQAAAAGAGSDPASLSDLDALSGFG